MRWIMVVTVLSTPRVEHTIPNWTDYWVCTYEAQDLMDRHPKKVFAECLAQPTPLVLPEAR